MLVLSRRLNEKVLFPGFEASVQVVAIKPGVIRLGIEAPPQVTVLREEVQGHHARYSRPVPHPENPGRSARLEELQHLTCRQLQTASLGLGLARLQLQAGQTESVQEILDQLHEDLQALRRRLEGKEKKPLPSPTESYSEEEVEEEIEEQPEEDELLAGCLS
ncbi:MAG: carbon storage regulator [Planctomycetes bacterium]|nr:carbon storage regulator [Planctomycetota bacterium]